MLGSLIFIAIGGLLFVRAMKFQKEGSSRTVILIMMLASALFGFCGAFSLLAYFANRM